MSKQLCILHANCQGDALKLLLELSPEFRATYDIQRVVNYESGGREVPHLKNCGLFLYQHLGPQWQEGCTDNILRKLPAKAVAVCIPNMFFKGYWPFWRNSRPGEIEFCDNLIEELLRKGLSHDDVYNLYLKCPPALAGDFAANASDSLEIEKKKEEKTPIKYVSFIEENWRKRQIFLTINHPGVELLALEAQSLLKMLGFAPLPDDAIKSFVNPHDEFWLPVHPALGQRLNLPFVSKDRKYPCFGSLLTHSQYISCYLACRKYNMANFTEVLMALDKSPRFLHFEK